MQDNPTVVGSLYMYKPNDRNRPRTNERVASEKLCSHLADDPGLFHFISSFHVHSSLAALSPTRSLHTHLPRLDRIVFANTREVRLARKRLSMSSGTTQSLQEQRSIVDLRRQAPRRAWRLSVLCSGFLFCCTRAGRNSIALSFRQRGGGVEWPLPVPRVCRGVRLVAHSKEGGNRTANKCQEIFLANPRRCHTYNRQYAAAVVAIHHQK